MQTIFKHKGIIIGIVAVVIILVGYMAYKSSNKEAPSSGGVTRQAVSPSTSAGGVQAGPGQEFVSQLLAIHNINLNLDLFTDPVFIGLQDFSRDIPEQPKYRPNPFAPVNVSELNGSQAEVTTRTATTSQPGVKTVKKPAASSGSTNSSGSGIFQAIP